MPYPAWGRVGTGGGGGTVDTVARTAIAAVRADTGETVLDGSAVLATDTNRAYINNTGGAVTISGSNEASLIADGLTLDGGGAQITEVVQNAGPLAGAAPAGATWGVDTTTGQAYYVAGGNWVAVPVAAVDLNTTISDETGGNYGGGAPVSAPVSPDTGDLHIEIYDDVKAYFTAVAGAFPATAQITEDRGETTPLYQFTTAPTTVAHGEFWSVGHDITFPAAPVNGQWVEMVPTGGDWLSGGVTNFIAPGATTVADGQTGILAAGDALRAIYDGAADNWVFATGGGAGSSATAYNTVADLPAATGESVGTEAKVTADPVSANNGFYIVANDGGGNFWVK